MPWSTHVKFELDFASEEPSFPWQRASSSSSVPSGVRLTAGERREGETKRVYLIAQSQRAGQLLVPTAHHPVNRDSMSTRQLISAGKRGKVKYSSDLLGQSPQ